MALPSLLTSRRTLGTPALRPGRVWLAALLGGLLGVASGSARAAAAPASSASPDYHLLRSLPIPGETGWDYLTVDPVGRRLYISNNPDVIVFDIDHDRFVGTFPQPHFRAGVGFVHGVAIADDLGRGFLSHEMPPSVLVFDLKTLATLGVTPTDAGTDGIVYDPVSRRVFAMDGKHPPIHDVTVIDAASGRRVGTLPLPGVPEFPGVDTAGHLYVNVESTSQLARFDTRTLQRTGLWPLGPCEHPSALAIDAAHRRGFAACDNRIMVMVDLDSGAVVGSVPTGDGVDATRFDPGTGDAFASAGDGTLTIAHEDSPRHLAVVQTVRTAAGARTMALDLRTHRVFLVAGRFGAAPEKPTRDNPHGYPVVVPGTARLLILGP